MEFGLSQEQVLLQDNVRRFLADRVPLDRVREFAAEADDADIWQGLADLGIAALLAPEAAGGLAMTHVDAAVVAEALGARVAPAPFLGSAVAAPVALSGRGHDELLGHLAGGTARLGLALSDAIGRRADAGVDVQDGRLSGKCLFVIDHPAGHYLVADRQRRLYLVDAAADGVTTRNLETIDRTRPTGELVLDATPAEQVSDDPALLTRLLDVLRVMLAADTLGAAQAMLDKAVAYAGERKQFGRAIGSFQAVKHMCAEMAAALEPARAMVWYAAYALDGLPDEAHVSACHTQAHLAEVGRFVARTATEVHGGMGFTDLMGLHYWFKRIGYNRQMLGSPELLRETAARAQNLST